MTFDATFNDERRDFILSLLDGWRIEDNPNTENVDESINPFITTDEFQNESANKTITLNELMSFYYSALNQSYIHTNRLDIDNLTDIEGDLFIQGVCHLCASNLWQKYNIQVNDSDMETTPSTSYGGILYKQAMNILQPFVRSKIIGMRSLIQDE